MTQRTTRTLHKAPSAQYTSTSGTVHKRHAGIPVDWGRYVSPSRDWTRRATADSPQTVRALTRGTDRTANRAGGHVPSLQRHVRPSPSSGLGVVDTVMSALPLRVTKDLTLTKSPSV